LHEISKVSQPITPDRHEREPQKLWGIITKKERWGFSTRGWLVAAVSTLAAFYGGVLFLHLFLAVTHRVDARILVVEGWVHGFAIHQGAEEFKSGSYEYVIATGGPVVGSGVYINDFNTAASVGADLLQKAGVPNKALRMVPSRVNDRDRTYSSAVALRKWFREHNMAVNSINVVTESDHARRTRLLFEKAFGSAREIGVISVANPDYDARYWWRYSDGVREVLGESIAYLYARLFFWPRG